MSQFTDPNGVHWADLEGTWHYMASDGRWYPGSPPWAAQKPQEGMSRGRKVFLWFIIGWQALMLLWLVTGIANVATHPAHCQYISTSACNNAAGAGDILGAGVIVFFWAATDVVLGVIWLVTRGRR